MNKHTKPFTMMHCPRCTGKTTAGIMKALSIAINAPGKEFEIKDHYQTPKNIEMNVVPAMRKIIDVAGLQGFVIYGRGDAWYIKFINPLES